MAHPSCWALVLVMLPLVSGARYADYSESKMPDYGGAIDYDGPRDSLAVPRADADDYHEHTQEVPVPVEYKFEEDRVSGKVDKRVKEVGEPDGWQNSVKKQKKYSVEENQEIFENYNSDELTSNFKSSHRPSKRRPRLKPGNHHNEGLVQEVDAPRSKHVVGYNRNRKSDIGNIDGKDSFDERGDDIEGDKDNNFDEDRVNVRNNHRNYDGDTTLRTARRKPRDRYVKPEREIDEDDPIDNIRRRTKEEFAPEGATPVMRRSQYRQDIEAKPQYDKKIDRFGPKKYDDYSEYYDMKRVHRVKEKLLKESVSPLDMITTSPYLRRTRPRMRYSKRTNTDYGAEILRRVVNPPKPSPNYDYENEENKVNEQVIRKETTTSIDYFIKTIGLRTFITSRRAMETSTPLTTVMKITRTSIIAPIMTTTATKSPKTLITAASTESAIKQFMTQPLTTPPTEDTTELEIPKENTTELSMAEKSRLSILKKAQKKEMVKGTGTKKPPVLLQVTNALHTLVMVEPPSSLQPWQRVHVVTEDTPQNVVKVKRLMRQKLVNNAKDVHELAENWDDMVCDYIDTALLETHNGSVKTMCSVSLMLFSFMTTVLL